MAKSKSGGTRSYLRGRIASDVYSIGRDASGKKQQVVRSLAEQVKNPQTAAQMAQRMRMASVAQLSKALHQFIDHSFDNVPNGQPSISEFTKRALQAYAADSALGTPTFGYLNYGSKNYPSNGVQVSEGKAKFNLRWCDGGANTYSSLYMFGGIMFADINFVPNYGDHPGYPEDDYTFGDFVKNIFGGSIENYITYIAIGREGENGDGKPFVHYLRIQPKAGVAFDTIMHGGDSIAAFIEVETSYKGVQSLLGWGTYSSENYYPDFYVGCASSDERRKNCACAVIFSKKVNGGYQHSRSFMRTEYYDDAISEMSYPNNTKFKAYDKVDANFADALATYPEGAERFLNGGEL